MASREGHTHGGGAALHLHLEIALLGHALILQVGRQAGEDDDPEVVELTSRVGFAADDE